MCFLGRLVLSKDLDERGEARGRPRVPPEWFRHGSWIEDVELGVASCPWAVLVTRGHSFVLEGRVFGSEGSSCSR